MPVSIRDFTLMVSFFAALAALGETSRADEKSEAKNHVLMIVAAAKSYRTEYGVWPSVIERTDNSPRPAKDLTVGDPSLGAAFHNSALFNVLRSIAETSNRDSANNPRRIVFVEARTAVNSARPTSGFADAKVADPHQRGCFFDPWGREYFVRFDYDESGVVESFAGRAVKEGVIAWSVGPDGIAGTEDDITSW